MRDVLCATVSRNGFRVAGPFASTSEVSGWIERWTPAVAILDAVLNDGSTADLAEAMRRRGVLVLVHEEVSATPRRGRTPPNGIRREDIADVARKRREV